MLAEWKGKKLTCLAELGVITNEGTTAVEFLPHNGTLMLPVSKLVALTLLRAYSAHKGPPSPPTSHMNAHHMNARRMNALCCLCGTHFCCSLT